MGLIGAYSAIAYIIGVIASWGLIAGFLPPTQPTAGADAIALIFENPWRIQVGMVLLMYCAFIAIVFSAAVSLAIKRVEGESGILTFTCLLGGAGLMVLTFYPAIWWLTAAFRPERSPELLQSLNDMAWLQFIGGVSMFDAMPLAVGIAAFIDKTPQPIFPRWAGYANFLIIMLILPDQLLFFFHGGPFAWNGLFGFWIPLVFFGGWFIMMFVLLRRWIIRNGRL